MSISQVNGNERVRAAVAAAALRTNAAYAPAGTPTRQPDSVSLSESARSLGAALKVVAAAPEVREERIQALKTAIANGTYAVDNRQLARAIIQHRPDLG